MTREQSQQFSRIIEQWRQNHKGTFLYEFTLLLEGVLQAVADVPVEIQSSLIEGQKIHEHHLCLLQDNILTLIENIRVEGETLTQHWDYATHERNEAHQLAQQMFADLHSSVEKLSRTDREREASFTRMMTERDKQQTAFLNRREHEIVTTGKQVVAKAKFYCVGVTILLLAFSGLFYYSQIQGKQLIAKQADAEVETRVAEQLRRVEPPAYEMALEIAKHGHEVVLDDGLAAWEVDLYRSSGVVAVNVTADENNRPKIFRVFMRGNPERITLASLAASMKNGDAQGVAK